MMLRFTMKLEVGSCEKTTPEPLAEIKESGDVDESPKASASDSDGGQPKPFRVQGFQGGAR